MGLPTNKSRAACCTPLVQRASRQAAKLNNLKMVIRDKAHACRRLLPRTVVVDPELKAINEIMLFGTPSIAKMLRDSQPCAESFEQVLKDQRQPSGAGQVPGGAAGPKHLGYAKQRFDNSAHPLGITVWDLDAVICTCDIISRDSSFDKRWRQLSRQFLDELSEERVLLLGMLADASDELLQLVRFFDKEAFAIEKMAEKVQSFKQTVQVLFHHGACLRTGFTKLCLAHLRMQKSRPRWLGPRPNDRRAGL